MIPSVAVRSLQVRFRRLLPRLATAPVLVVVLTGAAMAFDRSLSIWDPDGEIVYNAESEDLARTTADALGLAYGATESGWGVLGGPLHVYIYRSTEDMVGGLMSILGYHRQEAETIAKLGISPVTDNTLHIDAAQRTGNKRLRHDVIDAYVRGVTEAVYGKAVATSARWLYEGVGEYATVRALENRDPRWAESYKTQRYRIAFKRLLSGDYPGLRSLAGKEEWLRNIEAGNHPSNGQSAFAYVSVDYIMETYGLSAVKTALREIGNGTPADIAIERALGRPFWFFEATVLGSLSARAVLTDYRFHALAILLSGALVALGIAIAIAIKRRKPIGGSPKTVVED